ncbi:MAG: ribonuclease III [Chloroflexota bacterium]|nr:ribonuclease III [Chloroflexota bacterium]MDE2969136.1 ribonuclease III [Chloroflexota bacterium]
MDPDLQAAAQALGVRFRDLSLLRLSLTHSSYVNEHPQDAPVSNERLEYLGDAFLGMVVARRLYLDNPSMSEGDLTEARSAVVRGETLCEAAIELGLGEHLLLGQGEEQTGGRSKPNNLACAMEALIGAVYLDQGHEAAEAFVVRVLEAHIGSAGAREVGQDPKSLLQVAAQARGLGAPSYNVLAMTGPGHDRTYTVEVVVAGEALAQGSGRRKVDAERLAAAAALEQVKALEAGGNREPMAAKEEGPASP